MAAGIVFDGSLHRGANGAAGEIGHLAVDPAGPRAPCGQRGCLEVVASGGAITRRWPAEDARLRAAALLAAADAGDADAIVARDEFAAHLAVAVTVLALTFDPRLAAAVEASPRRAANRCSMRSPPLSPGGPPASRCWRRSASPTACAWCPWRRRRRRGCCASRHAVDHVGNVAAVAFELRGVNHLALVCRDMAATVDFYTGVLGMPLVKTIELPGGMGQHFFFDIGGGDASPSSGSRTRPRRRRASRPGGLPAWATSRAPSGR